MLAFRHVLFLFRSFRCFYFLFGFLVFSMLFLVFLFFVVGAKRLAQIIRHWRVKKIWEAGRINFHLMSCKIDLMSPSYGRRNAQELPRNSLIRALYSLIQLLKGL